MKNLWMPSPTTSEELRFLSVIETGIILFLYSVFAAVVLFRVKCSLDLPAYITMGIFLLCEANNLIFYLLEYYKYSDSDNQRILF